MDGTNNQSSKNWIFLSIIGLLLAGGIYLYLDKNNIEKKSGEEIVALNTKTQAVQDEYNAALSRLDAMKSDNSHMDSLLNTKDGELADLKHNIESIITNKNATENELKLARNMISQLNSKLDGYKKQIATLTAANVALATEKEKLSVDKEQLTNQNKAVTEEKNNLTVKNTDLEKKVDIAKILHASNIQLEPIKHTLFGHKEAETSKAKRADLMHIKFDLDDNRISETGEKQLYIVVYSPSGDAYGNSKFKMNDGTEKTFTVSKSIPYVQGQTSKNISLDWKPDNGNFEKGDYNVEIFHQGYKIGGNMVHLR